MRELKTKQDEEFAYNLLDLFTIFEVPSILQSEIGQEFDSKIIEEICGMWNDLKIVYGKPRDSTYSQGPDQRANQDIKKRCYLSLWNRSQSIWKYISLKNESRFKSLRVFGSLRFVSNYK